MNFLKLFAILEGLLQVIEKVAQNEDALLPEELDVCLQCREVDIFIRDYFVLDCCRAQWLYHLGKENILHEIQGTAPPCRLLLLLLNNWLEERSQ